MVSLCNRVSWGEDNSYLLGCLSSVTGRMRGVAVVSPATETETLDEMRRLGVTGVRWNLWGDTSAPKQFLSLWERHLEYIHGLGWHVELHASAQVLSQALRDLLPLGLRLVIDHFGRPDTSNAKGSVHASILTAAETGRVWVKLSAPYRLSGVDHGRCVSDLLASFGPDRLLWGSDWPWTQHEGQFHYADTLQWLEEWVADSEDRSRILWDTPCKLYGFPL